MNIRNLAYARILSKPVDGPGPNAFDMEGYSQSGRSASVQTFPAMPKAASIAIEAHSEKRKRQRAGA
jgi:uncharacterized protein YccT (UPF0319 family)